jgi:4-carboxymuconolactone decarboxylase
MDWTWNGGFELRTAADTDGDVQRVLEKLEATGQNQTILRLAANSPTVFRPFVLLANALVNKATLGDSEREALVLHLATKERAAYEWDAHQGPATKAGLTDEQIALLRTGEALQHPDAFTASEFLAVRLGNQIVEGGSLSEDDWAEATAAWGAEGALDLVFSVAWWAGFVLVFTRALDLRPATEG